MQEMTHKHTKELDKFYHKNRNACTNCGHSFSESETAHLGHLKDRSPAVLCDRCATLLDETVVRYYWMKDPFESPNPEDKLWRYMDMAKFISLLSTESLYFSPAESFDDPFEGAKGILEKEGKWNDYYLEFFRYAIKTAPGIYRATDSSFCMASLKRCTRTRPASGRTGRAPVDAGHGA